MSELATAIPEITPVERCSTCAYRPGTEASKSPLTQLKAKLCLETSEPFLCHEGSERALCRGWVDALTARIDKGNRGEENPWKKELLLSLNQAITEYEDRAGAGEAVDVDALVLEAVRRAWAPPEGTHDDENPGDRCLCGSLLRAEGVCVQCAYGSL